MRVFLCIGVGCWSPDYPARLRRGRFGAAKLCFGHLNPAVSTELVPSKAPNTFNIIYYSGK